MELKHAKVWDDLRRELPWGNTQEAKAKREKLWKAFDCNGNGYLSLAQCDNGIKHAINLPQLFKLKPVIDRSFHAAKKRLKAKTKYGDDYVSKAEFKYFLEYIRQYYEYWIAFDRIDTSGDGRLSRQQFKKAIPMMQKWGLSIKNPQATFQYIDKDGGGMILFDQFVRWAIQTNLDLDDDDDAL